MDILQMPVDIKTIMHPLKMGLFLQFADAKSIVALSPSQRPLNTDLQVAKSKLEKLELSGCGCLEKLKHSVNLIVHMWFVPICLF